MLLDVTSSDRVRFEARDVDARPGSETTALAHNIAVCLVELGQYEKALDFFERCLKSYKRCKGKDHNKTLTTLKNMVVCLERLLEKLPDGASAVKAEAYYRLGRCKTELKDYMHARNYFYWSIVQERMLHGEDAKTTNIYFCIYEIAGCLKEMRSWTGAIDLYQKSLAMMWEIHGNNANHKIITACLGNLGLCLCLDHDEYFASPKVLKESLAMSKALLDGEGINDTPPVTAERLHHMGVSL